MVLLPQEPLAASLGQDRPHRPAQGEAIEQGAQFLAGLRRRPLVRGRHAEPQRAPADDPVAVLSMPTPLQRFTPPNTFITAPPYVWLPVFLVQAAWFGHLLVFRRLAQRAN